MNNINFLIDEIMKNPNIKTNPIAKNALELYKKGDTRALNELANNICREKGMNPDEITQRIKSMFNI